MTSYSTSAPGAYNHPLGEEDQDERLQSALADLDENEEVEGESSLEFDAAANRTNSAHAANQILPHKSVPAGDQPLTQSQIENFLSARERKPKISLPDYGLPLLRTRTAGVSCRSPGARRKLGSAGVGKQHTIAYSKSCPKRNIECSVCYEPYGDTGDAVPRNLDCGHSFCSGCLQKLAHSFKVSCPKCTQLTMLDMHGVTNLMRNFAILEVIYSDPQSPSENQKLNGTAEATSPGIPQDDTRVPVRLCDEHGDHLTSFCMKDKVFVCSSCLLYGKHRQHPCKLVRDAALDCRQLLSDLVPNVVSQKGKMTEAVERVAEELEEVKGRWEQLRKEVDDHFDELVGVLNARRKELKLELLERGQMRVEALLQQMQSLREIGAACEDCHILCSNLINSDEITLLFHYSEAQRKIEGVFTNPPSCTPCAKNDLRVEFPANVVEELEGQFGGYGQLRSDVSTVQHLYSDSYHNGFRVYWQGHNYVDNQGISYAVQVAKGDDEFITQYRGGETKCTWKPDILEDHILYKFRVRVQTTDGVGNWSEPVICRRQPPSFRWHSSWRNVKIDLSPEKLEAWSTSSIHKLKYWCTVAGDTMIHQGQHYFEIELLKVWQRTSPKVALGVFLFKNGALPSDIHWQEGKHPIGHSALTSSLLSPSFLPQHSRSNSHEDYNSCSYLPSDGKKLSSYQHNKGVEYGDIPLLQQGDRIGMLISIREGTISFFLNGQDLGVAFTNITSPLLPAVSICDKIHLRLLFPPPPYMKRNPRLTLFSVSSSKDLL